MNPDELAAEREAARKRIQAKQRGEYDEAHRQIVKIKEVRRARGFTCGPPKEKNEA